MSITYHEASKSFKLNAGDTTYVISIYDTDQFIAHLYYGKTLPDEEINYLLGIHTHWKPSYLKERGLIIDSVNFEYPTQGIGDFREHCLEVLDQNGSTSCSLQYQSHKIYKGKPKLEDLPATFGEEDECETLEIVGIDKVLNLKITLIYTAFEKISAITRSTKIENLADTSIKLTRALSACLDLDTDKYDVVHLHGSWAMECNITRTPVFAGKQTISSARGETSAQDSPFVAVVDKNVTEETGDVYAMNFVYSGNFLATVEGTQYARTRMVMGINPQNFTWLLESGESFQTPEVVMVYSDEGMGKMTRTFHDLYRNHLIRGRYKDQKRPILINNWEATYFDFDTEKLLSIAREAKKQGIEMLVMDDGWFGSRNNDDMGLGDWVVNEEKLQGGLKHLVDEVNKIGLKFGIWVEPEMVNPDSDLYRAHPDWVIHTQNRPLTLMRNQLMLDWSRKEVRDHVYAQIKEVLASANIEYVKWDMNRQMTEIGNAVLPPDRKQELCHRYVLGVYDIMNRLTTDFPQILLENCSSGGGRFDAGMLYYSPQIWTSDDTDAIERLKIQHGTALCYPLSSMGAHVSDVPNHQTGRSVSFETRGYVALAGTFGYELDVTKISQEERDMIPKQVEMYHKYNDLIREGDYYRMGNMFEDNNFDCWMVVSKDKKEALVTYIQVMAKPGRVGVLRKICFRGLCPNTFYQIEGTDTVASGAALMNGGYWFENMPNDYQGKLVHLIAK